MISGRKERIRLSEDSCRSKSEWRVDEEWMKNVTNNEVLYRENDNAIK